MASSKTNLAVVICHGSYHTPALYAPLLKAFEDKGIEAHCPQLATADLSKLNVGDVQSPDFDREPPAGGYPQGEQDIQIVLEVLRPLAEKMKKIILIGHSSGGWLATEAARPELGIVGIFYMGGFVVPVGESIHGFFQPKDGSPAVTPPFMTFHKHGMAGLGTIVQPEKFLFNDIEESEARKWASNLTASPILTTKLTNNAYASVPCAYLVLEGDLTLPKEYQEGMVNLQASKTGDFKKYRSPAGHSPHLSWTSGVVEKVLDFAQSTGNYSS